MIKPDTRITITGGSGLVGHALREVLAQRGCHNVVAPTSREINLLERDAVLAAFRDRLQPEVVFHLAGTVLGLGGNLREPARMFVENTLINAHVIEGSRLAGARKIVAMGSICAYPFPPRSPGPLQEDDLFFGEPHPGERAYGHAKRGMLAQLEAYQASYGVDYAFAISTNLYGPADRFNLENGHVIPSLIRKFYEAAQSGQAVELWGDGSSTRDFMFSSDAARALVTIMDSLSGRVNLATGIMSSIRDVARHLGEISGVRDRIRFDTTKPKGHEFAGIDIGRLRNAGFSPAISLRDGLEVTYRWYAANHHQARR
jgi:GDP-L-fucose synthase